MRAVIPVAGIGTRLRPHTHTLPKVLLQVAGKPILGHILDELQAQGIRQYSIIVGFLREKVERYVRENYDLDVDFVTQEERQGLGHSIWVARETFASEPILIILGDTIFDVDLRPVLEMADSALGVKAVDDPRRFGVAHTNDKGFITKLVEKPAEPETNLALVGIYSIRQSDRLAECLDELIERDIRTRGEYQLTDALQLMIDKGEDITTFAVDGWFDCGKPETLLATNRFLLDKQQPAASTASGSFIVQPSFVAPDARLLNSVVGPYASIGSNAEIRDSIVRNSIVGEHGSVERALLEESLVGNNASVRGAFQRCNLGDSSETDIGQ